MLMWPLVKMSLTRLVYSGLAFVTPEHMMNNYWAHFSEDVVEIMQKINVCQ